MLTDELTADDFGIERNGIHLYEVDDGEQWYAYGHHDAPSIAEAINQSNRALGYGTNALDAEDTAEALEHVYLQRVDHGSDIWTVERCDQDDPGAAPVTVVTL
ncbi:hypothetical protein [Nocardia nova]|uniref:hypothetical protein n=1 Tax=Nocardia nova TaxID=37330 RepID=UPI0033DB38FB